MTSFDERSSVELPAVFEGVDEIRATAWIAPFAIVPIGLLLAGNVVALGVTVALAALFSLGVRYRCVVRPTGITLTRKVAFFVTVGRRRFLLDANPELYESWGSSRSEGVFFATPPLTDEESDPFGPYFSVEAQKRLCAEVSTVVEGARKLCPSIPEQVRFRPLNDQVDALQIVERYVDGRPRRAVAVEPLRVYGVEIPADSTLHFNHCLSQSSWVDPRRDDELWVVDCAAPTVLPWGFRVEEGARLRMWGRGEGIGVEGGRCGPIHIDDRWVDGRKPLSFDSDGRLTRYTLAEPVTIGEHGILPSGSEVTHLRGRSTAETVSIDVPKATQFAGRTYHQGQAIRLRVPWQIAGWHPDLSLEQFVPDPSWSNFKLETGSD